MFTKKAGSTIVRVPKKYGALLGVGRFGGRAAGWLKLVFFLTVVEVGGGDDEKHGRRAEACRCCNACSLAVLLCRRPPVVSKHVYGNVHRHVCSAVDMYIDMCVGMCTDMCPSVLEWPVTADPFEAVLLRVPVVDR